MVAMPAYRPLRLRPRLAQARRDLSMLWNGLAGRTPPPVIPRPPRADRPADALAGRPLRIERVERETPNAVSLYLADPEGAPLEFLPGQFLTFLVPVEGQTLRRAYSFAAPPLEGHAPHVTVKRVEGGRVSNHLNDHAEQGQTVRVLGPSGSFTVTPDPSAERHLVMLAGGSGITPIMSIAHAVLETEPGSRVTLLYGNRSLDDVIFLERLEQLAACYEGRLRVDHVLESAPEGWAGPVGKLDRDTVAARLDALELADGPGLEYFVCGPAAMMDEVHAALDARGVEAERIREERFTGAPSAAAAGGEQLPTTAQYLTIREGGREHTLVEQPEQTVLEAGLAEGIAMPHSCAMGGCGSCKVRLVSGDVALEEPNCLTPKEREAGWVLACVSHAKGPVTVEVDR